MGDRGNLVMVEESGNKIYFYTHWAGSELPKILRKALIRGKNRWNYGPYLARIIFSEMIKNDVLEETGYGISSYECENNHTNIEVSSSTQTVTCDDEKYSFEEYINLINPLPNF